MIDPVTYYVWWIKTVIEFYILKKANFIAWGPIIIAVPATIILWLSAKFLNVKHVKYSCLIGLGLLPFLLLILLSTILASKNGAPHSSALQLYVFLIAPQYAVCFLIALVFLVFDIWLKPTIMCIVFVVIQSFGVYWTYNVYLRL